MRKLGLYLLLAALTAFVVIGCGEDDDPKPSITRLFASGDCGVVPMRVDFRADATGGKPLSQPTGGNNWLKMTWDFGDGTVVEDGASIAYHVYRTPGLFTVTITAEDDRGETASRSLQVEAIADTLSVEAFSFVDDVPGTVIEACKPLQMSAIAATCGYDPVEDTDERFVFRWLVGDSIYRSPTPLHSFLPDLIGEDQMIVLRLEDPGLSSTRSDTIIVTVVESPGADLSLTADWLLSTPASGTPILQMVDPAVPNSAFTYTIRLRNDGPVDAYTLRVAGTLPRILRIAQYSSGTPSSGTVTYDPALAIKRWVWLVPKVAAGGEETLDIRFVNEVPWTQNPLEFSARLTAYACDPDTTSGQTITAELRLPVR